jgi:hypothetical protein
MACSKKKTVKKQVKKQQPKKKKKGVGTEMTGFFFSNPKEK